jgi:hypothetical protein
MLPSITPVRQSSIASASDGLVQRRRGPLSLARSLWQHVRPAMIGRERRAHRRAQQMARPVAEQQTTSLSTMVSYMSYDEEYLVADESVHPVLREATRLEALKRMLGAHESPADKVRCPPAPGLRACLKPAAEIPACWCTGVRTARCGPSGILHLQRQVRGKGCTQAADQRPIAAGCTSVLAEKPQHAA